MSYTRSILLTIIISIGCQLLFAQSEETKARGLTGDIYYVPFFINTSEGEFTEDEIQHFLKELQESKEWILSEKKSYDHVYLNIIDDSTDSHKEVIHLDNILSYKGKNYKAKNLIKNIALDIGFYSMEQYIKFNNINTENSKVVVLSFMKKNGSSHTFNYNEVPLSDNIQLNHILINCNVNYINQEKSTSISHEILHLFGAWDLYGYGRLAQSSEKGAKLKEMYPNSIMVKSMKSYQDQIDEITAWRIGWNLKPEKYFYDYEPEYEENAKIFRGKNSSNRNIIKFDLKKKKKIN